MGTLTDSLFARGLAVSPYTGVVGSRGMIANATNAQAAGYKTRSVLLTRIYDRMPWVSLLPHQGFTVPQTGGTANQEVSLGTPIEVRASLRTRQGGELIGQFRFSGELFANINSPVVPLASDQLKPNSPLPPGDYLVDQFITWPTGTWHYRADYPGQSGEGFASGTGIADGTGAQTTAGLSAVGANPPPFLSLRGPTTRRSAIVIGDSLDFGFAGGDCSALHGLWQKALGNDMPINVYAISSTLGRDFVEATAARRLAMCDDATDIFWGYFTNDALNSRTSAQMGADAKRLAALRATKRNWFRTVPPITTSANSGAVPSALDGSDQAFDATLGAQRIAFNALLRAGLDGAPGYAGFVDFAEVFQHPTNENLWAPGMCRDTANPRVHATPRGERLAAGTAYGRERIVAGRR
jgi:hypothetical protein